MTSKISFWASLLENNKRRIWLWALSVLTFVVGLPTAVALNLSRGMLEKERFYLQGVLDTERFVQFLSGKVAQILGINGVVWVFVVAMAVISAIQGYSYLYHRHKIDFYVAMPVKRSRRFWTIWLNGILVYLIPYLIGVLLSFLIASVNGALTKTLISHTLATYGILFLFYLGVYHLAILAVMVTGNLVITCFTVAVLFLYELVVKGVWYGYGGIFYTFYSNLGNNFSPVFSPFAKYFKIMDLWNYNGIREIEPRLIVYQTLFLLLLALAVLPFAYLCYWKRPAEAAGKAIAFPKFNGLVKVLMVVPVTLLCGIGIAEIVGYSPVYRKGGEGLLLFGMAIVLVVGCCLMQVIYEFDIKGALHQKKHILISGLLCAVVFGIFRFDLFGYDSYIPKVEKVESAYLVLPTETYRYGQRYFDEDFNNISTYEYIEEHMYLTDIGALNKLLKESQDEIAKMESLDDIYKEGAGNWHAVDLCYRMKNNRKVCREVYVNLDDEEMLNLLDRIEGSEEYILGANMGASDTVIRMLESGNYMIDAEYGNGVYENGLSAEDAMELLRCYQEDIRGASLKAYRSTIPTGSLGIQIQQKMNGYFYQEPYEVIIYPFFENSVDFLKKKGIYRERFVDPDDVERIVVTNYNYDAVPEEADYYESAEYMRYATYTSREDIEKLSDRIFPLSRLHENWHTAEKMAEYYNVTVYFKENSGGMESGGVVSDFGFAEGNVPNMVERDTIYEP